MMANNNTTISVLSNLKISRDLACLGFLLPVFCRDRINRRNKNKDIIALNIHQV